MGGNVKQPEALMSRHQLDAQISLQEIREREKLWQLAQGRFGWRGAIGYLSPILLLVAAVSMISERNGLGEFMRERRGEMLFILAFTLLGFTLWANAQRQLTALVEIVKRLERSRS
jgi:hypothetical protein